MVEQPTWSVGDWWEGVRLYAGIDGWLRSRVARWEDITIAGQTVRALRIESWSRVRGDSDGWLTIARYLPEAKRIVRRAAQYAGADGFEITAWSVGRGETANPSTEPSSSTRRKRIFRVPSRFGPTGPSRGSWLRIRSESALTLERGGRRCYLDRRRGRARGEGVPAHRDVLGVMRPMHLWPRDTAGLFVEDIRAPGAQLPAPPGAPRGRRAGRTRAPQGTLRRGSLSAATRAAERATTAALATRTAVRLSRP